MFANSHKLLLSWLCAFTLLSGCSLFGSEEREELGADLLEEELYQEAMNALESSSYQTAIRYLSILESNFPFGQYAEQAQLELIHAYYKSYAHDQALSVADRFIRLHPEHVNVDYAYYMRGLISFTRETSFLGQFLPLDITTRDPGSARESFAHFSELLVRFPESSYAPDARKRMMYLRNLLARHEINVANYYFERGAYVAALNRGRYVVENFQQTPAVPDGLAVMAQAYILLGYDDLSNDAVAALRLNYPEHPALDESGDFEARDILSGKKRSIINRLTFGLADRPEPLGFDTRELYNPEYQRVAAAEDEDEPNLFEDLLDNGPVSEQLQERHELLGR